MKVLTSVICMGRIQLVMEWMDSNLLIGGDDCFLNIQLSQGICANIGNIMVFDIHVTRSKLCELSINVHFEDFVERLIVCLQEVRRMGKHTNDYDSRHCSSVNHLQTQMRVMAIQV